MFRFSGYTTIINQFFRAQAMYNLIHQATFNLQSNRRGYFGPISTNKEWLGIRDYRTITPINLKQHTVSETIRLSDDYDALTAISPDGERVAALHNGTLSITKATGVVKTVRLASPVKITSVYTEPIWYENIEFTSNGNLVITINSTDIGLLILLDGNTLEIIDRIERTCWAEVDLHTTENGIVVVQELCGDTPLGIRFYRCDAEKLELLPNWLNPLDDNLPDMIRATSVLEFTSTGDRFRVGDGYEMWEMDWDSWKPIAGVLSFFNDNNDDDLRVAVAGSCYLEDHTIAVAFEDDRAQIANYRGQVYEKICCYSTKTMTCIGEVDLPKAFLRAPKISLYSGSYFVTNDKKGKISLWTISKESV